jgi:hypothetical protein
MHESISKVGRRPKRTKPSTDSRTFAARRVDTIDRLVRAGMPHISAETWIDAWVTSTADLPDFRRAPDFWAVGYQFAVEEHGRSTAAVPSGESHGRE